MEEKIVYNGFVKVKEVPVKIKEKNTVYNEICVLDAVAAVLYDETGRIGLVSQYRPLAKVRTKEIVGETLDKPNLTPRETLIEGLLEEAGVSEDMIIFCSEEPVFEYHMMIGCSNAKILIYEVKVTEQEDKRVDDTQVDFVEWVTLDEFKAFIDSNEIKDSKTLLAYYYLLNKKDELGMGDSDNDPDIFA